MINQQLVDYIKQQLQAGVAKDAVRKALIDAGWPVPDIDDSTKAAEPAAVAVGTAAAGLAVQQAKIDPVVAMGGTDAVARQPMTATGPAKSSVGDKFFAQSSALQTKHEDDGEHPSVKKFMAAMIAMGVVILLLAGALAFTYFNLNGQLSAAQQSGSGSSGQTAALQGQVRQLTADNGSLTARVTSLTATTTELMNELAFFAMPPALAPTASSSSTSTPVVPAPIAATVQGRLYSLSSVQQPYLMTAYNVKINIANYKDAKVSAALTPLYNATSTVQLSGTHAAGSPNLTVTAVNGAAL